ncbi:alpha-2-macroglobulin family protein [Pseudoponticoccus marisrubri]|uniref:PAN domain-containing protein n=1 Tax=Pseudoponticoccus marisrubri TaxID=1685382 RepID=A0A0W7WIT4_9RHOB|nr:alpha-2-macroglobulin family protein [Pseudoponticoccus marisrubri]KUF10524.1 PAN domain-containing protein [Pseudoponticoccus marisrubri]
MRRFVLALVAGLVAATSAPAQDPAQDVVPDRRLVVTRDVDFYGADLQTLFDTTLEACQRVCLNDPACRAFTFNKRSAACFPKSSVSDRQAYEGAISAIVVEAGAERLELAQTRRAELDFLSDRDLRRARDEAAALAVRHGGGQWSPEALLNAADENRDRGNQSGAIHWTGAALAQTDDGAHWQQYADWSMAYVADAPSNQKRRYRTRAFLGAINAYLRAEGDVPRVEALFTLARMLEAEGRGRDMIPALRLAERISATPEVTALLDEAIGKYGFRIREHVVEADSADPRICAEFSEPLIRAGQDYAPYVRLPDPRLAVSAEEQRICISGVEHGGRYTVTFRSRLPAESGEELVRETEITAYVRDRAPSVSFPGRAYVLPRTADAGLPIETVNLSEVELILRRVSDRNLIRSMQDNYFGRPLNRYDESYFGEDIAEEVWRGTGEVENRLNADMLTRLPIGEALGDLPAGVYALTAIEPGEGRDRARATQWFILSDIGLTTMQGTDGLTVVARDLGDAAPIEGLEVELLASANRVLGTATTDAAGLARFDPGLLRGDAGSAPALVIAKRGETDMAFLSLTDPAFDLSDRGVAGRAPAGPLDTFLTTDRGAYRAGEVIHATALLRDAKARAVPDVPLIAILSRPDGVEYSRHVSDGGRAGGHVFALPVAGSAPRGTWRLAVFADPDAEALASQTLLVEDFVPERIDFDLSLPDGPINPLAPPPLSVDARYLFGAPGADLSIEGELQLATQTTLDSFPRYSFGRHDARRAVRTESFPADLVTDAQGHAALDLPMPDLDAEGRPMRARVTLRLAEASGRPVEREITRPVAAPAPMIGIRPAFEDVLPEGAEAGFDLIALGPDLQPQAMEVSWQINRVRTRYQWYQQYGSWYWEPMTTRTTVARGTGTLGETPLRVAGDVDWGAYEIVVERTDGAYVAASAAFSAGWYAPADATESPDMLELSLDAEAYAPGDTATLRMVPRYAGRALVTVMADRVISMQTVEVPEGETTLALPVTEEWGAGVYVTAQVIRPMDLAQGQNPARALGLAHAAVDPGERKLSVSFDAPAEAAPRQTLRAAVQIDGLGEGDQAHVTVAAVDLGILNLTGFDSPDPSGYYFGQRRLGVEIRDIYGRLIDGMNGAMGTIRSGGDGGAGMRLQSPPPTEELVAFFEGPVTVDASGRAELAFDMPDFNGTVRLMAVAWSDSAVGGAEAEVLVRDPVVLTAAMPRFLAPGDDSRLHLELTHAKGPGGTMPLEVTATGVTLDTGALPEAVTLEAGGKLAFDLPLTAGAEGDHAIEIALTTPDGQRLTKSLTLGVRANDPAIGTTRRLSLAPGQSLTLDREIFAGFREGGASALVSAGPLARFDAPGLLAALDRYPYGCTEQVTSQALPLLYMSAITEPLGLGGKDRMDLRVAQSITQILARQAPNGAFGLWGAYSGDFWLDAYVSDFLSRARAAGHDVPGPAFQNAMDNLKNRIAYAPDFDTGGEDIAYALLVLAREGAAAMGDLRYYADEKADALSTPLAQAQLGAALAMYGDQPRADALFRKAANRLAARGTPDAQVYRADYGSRLRDAAGVLSLAVEARSNAVETEALVQRISSATRPLSTQEQAWALLAAHAMVQDPSVSGLELEGEALTGPFVRRLQAAGLEPMTLTNTGQGPTPVTLTTLGQPEGNIEATGYGYALERAYYTMEGEAVDGPVAAGTRLVAVLTVRPAEEARARLIVDDALPAGFEIDNPNLLRAGDLRALDWLEPARAEHAEFRTDRFIAAVDQSGDDPIRLAYVLRAVSPGTFHHPAALVEDMYRPEYRATTASGSVTITP